MTGSTRNKFFLRSLLCFDSPQFLKSPSEAIPILGKPWSITARRRAVSIMAPCTEPGQGDSEKHQLDKTIREKEDTAPPFPCLLLKHIQALLSHRQTASNFLPGSLPLPPNYQVICQSQLT